MGKGKSEQSIVKVSLGNAKSPRHRRGLEGAVYAMLRERRRVPYTVMDTHRYIITFAHQQLLVDAYCISESRMREIRLSGLGGGLLKYCSRSMEGGLP